MASLIFVPPKIKLTPLGEYWFLLPRLFVGVGTSIRGKAREDYLCYSDSKLSTYIHSENPQPTETLNVSQHLSTPFFTQNEEGQ